MKTALKSGVPEDERIQFQFNQKEYTDLIWVKSNEFILNGNYFDVITSTFNGETYILNCISDQQETQLFKDLHKEVTKNLGDDSSDLPHNKIEKINKCYSQTDQFEYLVLCTILIPFELNSFQFAAISDGFINLDEHPPTV